MPLRSDFMEKHLILCLLVLFTLVMLIYHEHWKVQLEAMAALNEGKLLIQANLKMNTIL